MKLSRTKARSRLAAKLQKGSPSIRYMKQMGEGLLAFRQGAKAILTTADDELCRKIEPGVCPTSRRFEVLQACHEAGIPTVDVIPFYPDCDQSSFGPTWHTVNDDMEHLDINTLKAVGQTLIQVIYSE